MYVCMYIYIYIYIIFGWQVLFCLASYSLLVFMVSDEKYLLLIILVPHRFWIASLLLFLRFLYNLNLTYLAVELFVLFLSEFVEILKCGDFYQIGNIFGNFFSLVLVCLVKHTVYYSGYFLVQGKKLTWLKK